MNGIEQLNPPLDWQQLAQENGSLRVIIAELLIKNQKLRWELSGRGPINNPQLLVNVGGQSAA
jgi:hypothetical protein